ncbi:DNA excision repair protein ERCC-6-like [Rhopalosiphum maidis]|uniref:DNA excision repair protein ERCC-6-like n=1 Tax=Rhopalosiphum maidis TaxID=43146 RepID=UPI000EFF7029|nr:DNA excision repair protein ERCC-6-like [Rhopalosiphum maidis]XP_026820574.1 DNA excision repair protein ERCC-6-like [Rhopalosiphum maidis]
MMESLDQLSSNNLEVMDVERVSINSSVMNIDRNKIEAIPKTNQPIELQDLTGLTVYDVNHFEQEVLQQVTNEVLDNKTIYNTVEVPTLGVLGIEETENERKIRTGEMTPFGSTDVSQKNSKSSSEMLEKYLLSQSKLSTMIHKSKIKTSSTKKEFKINMEPIEKSKESGSEYFPSTDSENESYTPVKIKSKKRSYNHQKCNQYSDDDYTNGTDDEYFEPRRSSQYKSSDDGIEENYEYRLREYEKNNPEIAIDNDDAFHSIDGDYFKVPKEIWERLYKYQKIGIKWLWELHQQGSGGILGDEMGLGKTIQMIVFFGGLYWSRLKDKITGIRGLGPSLIVCPATLMHQWVDEFHKWCPPIRVVVLHETGAYKGKPGDLIKQMWSSKGVLITTYNGLLQHIIHLLKNDWHYVILDEGHKIRNPDSKITVAAKQLKSSHRIIISGSPIQNHLKELWSLFDFIFPSKLGTLPAFIKSFAVPITHGGYANATELQITTAYKCATILKDTISPYLLRRMKADIQSHISLPDKSEQVLFCRLTEEQKKMYRGYLENSDIISEITNGNCKVFVGISRLRTICNHPDIFQTNLETGAFGYWKKSGKMIVVEALLKMWKKQGHRVLLFTQSVKMLNIFQKFIIEQNYTYLKLEGSTSIGSRQPIINKFNKDPSIFVMILTTKVGGLGVNLIGANRVIIFDPDWNPATDLQARERAWRIGQTNSVTIYRLLTAGTIEEKMYHRQIFKQFISNKVLVDPKQRRFFKSNYLYELFTLQDVDDNGVVETSDLFAGTGSEINLKKMMIARRERKKSKKTSSTHSFSDDKIEAMKQKARELSKMIGQNSKTDINQQITPSEMCTNSEHCSNVDIIYPCQDDTEISKNNDKPFTIVSNESLNIPSCSKSEMIKASNHAFKRKNSKYLNTKQKKPKIPYLVKCDIYQEEHVDDLTSKKQDDYVLEKLFNKSGVKAAMRHDKIMESSKSDYVIIENEAQKLAKKAIEDLEASRAQCWETGSGRLNWTGNQGTVRSKLFHNVENSNESSGPSILSLMKKRNGIVEATQREMQMLNSIRQYLLENNQSVNTDQIVNQFRNKYSADDTPLFKSLLSEVCTFNRCPDKTGVWTLKPKYC